MDATTVSATLRTAVAARHSATAARSWERQVPTVSWPALVAEARATGLAPLLYDQVQGVAHACPPPLLARLRRAYVRTAKANTLLLHALSEALAALARAGIPALVLKGAALAPDAYGNVALRPMCDLDVLVSPGRVAAAVSSLAQIGFRPATPLPLVPHESVFCYALPLRREAVVLELHWRWLDNPYYATRFSPEMLWARRRTVSIGGVPAGVPAPEDQLLHLCAHHVHHHLGALVRTGPDVAALLHRHGAAIAWAQVLQDAERCELVQALQVTLAQAARQWVAPVPDGVQATLRGLRPTWRERFFVACRRTRLGKRVGKGLRTPAVAPGIRGKGRYLWSLLFPGRAYMAWWYGAVPEMPLWRAYLMRLLHIFVDIITKSVRRVTNGGR